jgi:hypothetical protein
MPKLPHSSSLAIALALAMLPPFVRADCIDDAAARHHVNAVVLRAIGWHESRLQPWALGHNANGSVDLGAFQINSIHLSELARHGVDRTSLADGCVSAEVAAWHYRRQVEQQGDTWLAVGAYHSHTVARAAWYANRIATILMRWKALPAGSLPFPADRTLAPDRPTGPRRSLPSATLPPKPSQPAKTRLSTPGNAPSQGVEVLAFAPSAR